LNKYVLENSETDEILDDLAIILTVVNSSRYLMQFSPNSVPKSTYFLCEVLPNISENQFKQLMRVDWKTFRKIVSLVRDDDVFEGARTGKQFPIETQVAVALYRLGSSGEGSSISKVSSLFAIGNGGTVQVDTFFHFSAIMNR